jgi:hypothetical protein
MTRRTGVKLCWVLVLLAVSLSTVGFPDQAAACCACGIQSCWVSCDTYPSGPERDACLDDCEEAVLRCYERCPTEVC